MISGEEWDEAGLKGRIKGNFVFIERYNIFLEEMHTVSNLLFSRSCSYLMG